jgi:hypothetical protein
VKGRRKQMVVAALIALVETLFRLMADRGVPMPIAFSADPALLSLAIVGPIAKFIDMRRVPARAG